MPPEPFLVFLQWTRPIHNCRSKTHVLGCFTQFHCRMGQITKMGYCLHTRLSHYSETSIRLFIQWVLSREQLRKLVSAAYKAQVYASRTVSCFVTSNKPNPLFQSKTHVMGGSMPFRSRTWHVAKTGIKAHLMHEFVPLEPFHFFAANMPNTLL